MCKTVIDYCYWPLLQLWSLSESKWHCYVYVWDVSHIHYTFTDWQLVMRFLKSTIISIVLQILSLDGIHFAPYSKGIHQGPVFFLMHMPDGSHHSPCDESISANDVFSALCSLRCTGKQEGSQHCSLFSIQNMDVHSS